MYVFFLFAVFIIVILFLRVFCAKRRAAVTATVTEVPNNVPNPQCPPPPPGDDPGYYYAHTRPRRRTMRYRSAFVNNESPKSTIQE